MKNINKYILIIIQVVALIAIVLDYLKIISNKYIPLIGYTIILISLVITLLILRRNKRIEKI